VTGAPRFDEARATNQQPHVAGSWLWLDPHTERALARGQLPVSVIVWCAELRAERALILRTARQRRRSRR
jgi:hypothetical protein